MRIASDFGYDVCFESQELFAEECHIDIYSQNINETLGQKWQFKTQLIEKENNKHIHSLNENSPTIHYSYCIYTQIGNN